MVGTLDVKLVLQGSTTMPVTKMDVNIVRWASMLKLQGIRNASRVLLENTTYILTAKRRVHVPLVLREGIPLMLVLQNRVFVKRVQSENTLQEAQNRVRIAVLIRGHTIQE